MNILIPELTEIDKKYCNKFKGVFVVDIFRAIETKPYCRIHSITDLSNNILKIDFYTPPPNDITITYCGHKCTIL